MLVTADGIVESVSAAITRLTGIDQEDVIGAPLTDLVVETDRAQLLDAPQAAASGAMATVTVDRDLLGTRSIRFHSSSPSWTSSTIPPSPGT